MYLVYWRTDYNHIVNKLLDKELIENAISYFKSNHIIISAAYCEIDEAGEAIGEVVIIKETAFNKSRLTEAEINLISRL